MALMIGKKTISGLARRAMLLCVLALGAGTVFTPPALAAPQISINTKVAEISVEIDDALKAHPGLVADLTAEGRTWAAKMRADADKEGRESPDSFTDGRKWSIERMYASRS